jgi:hypothetical protein
LNDRVIEREEAPMMSEQKFWELIDEARCKVDVKTVRNTDDFLDQEMQNLREALRGLSPEDILHFAIRFYELRDRAYRWDIWGAAYWLGGGCGNDGFMDFRGNLISLGRKMYERVVDDPDNLADIYDRPDVPYLQAEGFEYVAGEIYEEATGQEMILPKQPRSPKEPAGERWDFDDKEETGRRLPKLVKKLPDIGD